MVNLRSQNYFLYLTDHNHHHISIDDRLKRDFERNFNFFSYTRWIYSRNYCFIPIRSWENFFLRDRNKIKCWTLGRRCEFLLFDWNFLWWQNDIRGKLSKKRENKVFLWLFRKYCRIYIIIEEINSYWINILRVTRWYFNFFKIHLVTL